jgi:phosphoglycerate dehydrogenase-like enzyme
VFFADAFGTEGEAAVALADFDVLLTMRERTAFPETLIRRLSELRMISITGASLDMNVSAWSPNLTEPKAQEAGARLVSKVELMSDSDAVSVHMVLSPRSRGIIGAQDIARMKKGAILINTSRGPLIDESALVAAVKAGKIIAALDVYDREPLPQDHPFRASDHTVLTPHLGYGVTETWSDFYPRSLENAEAFLDGKPIRVLNAP